MIIYTNNKDSILFRDLVYNLFLNEEQIIESNDITKNDIYVYVVHNDVDFDFLNNIKCKKLIIDYSSNDCIQSSYINNIEKNVNREYKIISKSLDFKELNHLFYDQQMYRFKESFDALNSYDIIRKNFYQTNLLPHKKATFFVGHPRYHKLKLLNQLYLNKKLNELYWTSSDVRYDLPKNIHWGMDNMDRQNEYFGFDVIKKLPQKLDYDYETSKHHLVSIGITLNWGFYLNSCFDIVGETNFRSDLFIHHISEKLLKPIMLGVPFVCLNLPNTIQKLQQNFGFNFSDNIFKHEYDTIESFDDRLDFIKNEVLNLLNYDKSDLKEFSYIYFEKQKENKRILFEVFYKGSLQKIMEYIDE